MKWLLPALLIVTLVGCGFAYRELSVKDVTKSETIILKKKPSQGSIGFVEIVGRGSISGKAEVQWILDGAVHRREEVSGSISLKWGEDWFADQVEIRYVPGSASNGRITFKYEFHGL